KNPIYMDSNYSYYGKDRDKLPTFNDITLRNVRIAGPGKITLDGYDASHRLGIGFENVILEDPTKVKVSAVHADVAMGPGLVNFALRGEDVTIKGHPGNAPEMSCASKFVKFPEITGPRE